jgi:hypothetical protein
LVWLIWVGFRRILFDCPEYQAGGICAVAPSANYIADTATGDGPLFDGQDGEVREPLRAFGIV